MVESLTTCLNWENMINKIFAKDLPFFNGILLWLDDTVMCPTNSMHDFHHWE